MTNNGRFEPGNNANPTGIGGFADNPQNINYGGRPKNQESFTYWLNFFKGLTVAEFNEWGKNKDDISVAANLAYIRIQNAKESLHEFKEVADRTEGKAPQTIDFTSEGKPVVQPLIVSYIAPRKS